jgi:hypothetical protein
MPSGIPLPSDTRSSLNFRSATNSSAKTSLKQQRIYHQINELQTFPEGNYWLLSS